MLRANTNNQLSSLTGGKKENGGMTRCCLYRDRDSIMAGPLPSFGTTLLQPTSQTISHKLSLTHRSGNIAQIDWVSLRCLVGSSAPPSAPSLFFNLGCLIRGSGSMLSRVVQLNLPDNQLSYRGQASRSQQPWALRKLALITTSISANSLTVRLSKAPGVNPPFIVPFRTLLYQGITGRFSRFTLSPSFFPGGPGLASEDSKIVLLELPSLYPLEGLILRKVVGLSAEIADADEDGLSFERGVFGSRQEPLASFEGRELRFSKSAFKLCPNCPNGSLRIPEKFLKVKLDLTQLKANSPD